jgi:hypothetical protein
MREVDKRSCRPEQNGRSRQGEQQARKSGGIEGAAGRNKCAGITSRSRQGKVQHAAGRRRFDLKSVETADRNR